jgi:adenylate kinase family enzyme
VKRIAVVGPAGAGKSRLARELSELLRIPVLHLDALYWRPGWVATPAAEWEARQRRELAADSWIVDAQYDDMLPAWFEGADTIVFVDASLLQCLWRVTRRRFNRGAAAGVPTGSEPAPVHRAIAKFLRGHWHYRRTVRPKVLSELSRARHRCRVVVFRRERDLGALLGGMDSPSRAGGTL